MRGVAIGTPYAGVTTATGNLATGRGLIERGQSASNVPVAEVRGSAQKEWQHVEERTHACDRGRGRAVELVVR